MKRTFAFLLLLFASTAMAQDVITLKSGEEMKARIIRLNPNDVAFIPENGSDTAYLLREDIMKLQYKSGIIIILSENEKPELVYNPGNDSLFIAGQKDALLYYKGYMPAAIGTMITSVFFPLGLIPAVACSATPPAIDNLDYKDPILMKNSSYYDGYTKKAHEIKKKKVWGGFAIGSGFIIGISIMISVIGSNSL